MINVGILYKWGNLATSKMGFNGEVVTYEGEFFYIFKPFMKKVVDFCEKIVMDRHERKRQKLLKNRNKDMQ